MSCILSVVVGDSLTECSGGRAGSRVIKSTWTIFVHHVKRHEQLDYWVDGAPWISLSFF
jgi:hypothetical protein